MSYRDVEELLCERSIEVDHVTIYRWVQTFTREFIDAARALDSGPAPVEVTADRAPVYPRVLDELVPGARHGLEQYANNRVESDHARLKARVRPMRGMKTIRSLQTIAAGHAFVQNLRRGHHELTANVSALDRVGVAFDDLARFL